VCVRGVDTKHKVQQACELRDSIEVFQATDYKRFLNRLIPVFLKILGEGQPIFVSTIPEQAYPLLHSLRSPSRLLWQRTQPDLITEAARVYPRDPPPSPPQ